MIPDGTEELECSEVLCVLNKVFIHDSVITTNWTKTSVNNKKQSKLPHTPTQVTAVINYMYSPGPSGTLSHRGTPREPAAQI